MIKYLKIGAIILCAATILQIHNVHAQGSSVTPAQKTEFEKLIRDYIRSHPEIVLEAIQTLRDRERNAKLAIDRNLIVQNEVALYKDDAAPIAGNASGDVTVVEFFDYNCGFCKRVFPAVETLVKNDRKIRIVYKEFPILGPNSRFAAHAALASRSQGNYHKFHQSLMQAKGALTRRQVLKVANKTGLDRKKLLADMKAHEAKFKKIIQKNLELAKSLNITGTPAFVVGGVIVRGAVDYQSLKELVKATRVANR